MPADYQIAPGSPVVGRGSPLAEVRTDFFGKPRGASNDIGAHQPSSPEVRPLPTDAATSGDVRPVPAPWPDAASNFAGRDTRAVDPPARVVDASAQEPGHPSVPAPDARAAVSCSHAGRSRSLPLGVASLLPLLVLRLARRCGRSSGPS